MKKSLGIILSVLAIAILFSCEDEFQLNAPYEKIPVIYGVLDASVDTQFIMINRSFLGSGNATEFTAVEDSFTYETVDARIYWGSGPGEFVELDTIRGTSKQTDGVFFAPEQLLYFAKTSDMAPLVANDDSKTYSLEALADGDLITAETKIPFIGNTSISNPPENNAFVARFVSTFQSESSAYLETVPFEFSFVEDANTHEGSLVFHYVDELINGTLIPRSVVIPYGSVDADGVSSNSFDFERNGLFFYQQLADRIEDDPTVARRHFDGRVDFVLAVAGSDLSTYLGLGDPVSAVGQERPTFSNINNGDGVGIFSSRATYVREKSMRPFNVGSGQNEGTSDSMRELIEGPLTSNLCFCDPVPGNFYFCGTYTCP